MLSCRFHFPAVFCAWAPVDGGLVYSWVSNVYALLFLILLPFVITYAVWHALRQRGRHCFCRPYGGRVERVRFWERFSLSAMLVLVFLVLQVPVWEAGGKPCVRDSPCPFYYSGYMVSSFSVVSVTVDDEEVFGHALYHSDAAWETAGFVGGEVVGKEPGVSEYYILVPASARPVDKGHLYGMQYRVDGAASAVEASVYNLFPLWYDIAMFFHGLTVNAMYYPKIIWLFILPPILSIVVNLCRPAFHGKRRGGRK